MKYRLMDLLACPICKSFPLKLYIFSKKQTERELSKDEKKPLCELYCAYYDKNLSELKEIPPCEICIKDEIVEGLLYCEKCGRWYPIIDEIPRMLPDSLRIEKDDIEFLRKHKNDIPRNILEKGLPYNLKELK